LIAERALVLARRRFLGGVSRGRVDRRTTADVTDKANLSGLTVPAALAPLATSASVATASAVDVRFQAVLPVVRAVVADAIMSDGVAGV
jgi:hypothetical protein